MTAPPDPFEFATWTEPPDVEPSPSGTGSIPANRPTEWNGKPIPDNALWSDDGVTPLTTPTGRIRRSRGPKSTTGKVTPGKPASQVDLAQVESDMVDLWAKVAMAVQLQMPTVGMVVAHRGEQTSRAMVQIARNRPKMLAAMQKAANVGPAAELLQTGVMIVAAIALDTGRANVNDPIAVVTGVSELHLMVNPDAARPPMDPAFRPPSMPEEPMSAAPPYVTKDMPGDITDPEHARYAFSAGAGAGNVPWNGNIPGAVTPLRGGPFGGGPFPA